jgi:signal transduction histidine kinase
LLLYTHIPPAVIALVFAGFLLVHKRDVTTYLLASIAVVFSVYSSIDLLQWILVGSGAFIMASWSVLGLLTVLIYFLTHAFFHAFTHDSLPPRWMLLVWLAAVAPVILLSPTRLNISAYDLRDCIAHEGPWFTNYYYSLGLLCILLLTVSLRSRTNSNLSRSAANIVYFASVLFVSTVVVTGVLASYLVELGLIPDFGLTQYGIAAMSAFIGFLAYVTAYYRGFDIKTLAAQLLVTALVIAIGAQLLFVRSNTNRLLTLISLTIAVLFGAMLIRSVRKEVEQRELIEKQEKELQIVNRQQESLLHFISHEVKGFLSEGQNAFAAIVEGDFGEAPPKVKELSQTALTKMRHGVSTVMDILDASNLKKGSISYAKTTCDIGRVIESAISNLRERAEVKRISISYDAPPGEHIYICDAAKIERHVIRNLIDNAIRYTPSGSISISLRRENSHYRIEITDTGVGITPEDMTNLFTEGGHGKESIKINVDSTGFGLYVAKQVVVSHGGKIWAESEGKGKGSRFIVELPLSGLGSIS